MASGGGSAGLGILAAMGPVGASLAGGIVQTQAAEAGQQQVKTQMEGEKAAAAQRAAEVRRQLAATLGTQQAILASRGISGQGDGSTASALSLDSIAGANRDLTTNKFNLGQKLAEGAFAKGQYGLQKTAAMINTISGIEDSVMQMTGIRSAAGGPSNVSVASPSTGSTPFLSYGKR